MFKNPFKKAINYLAARRTRAEFSKYVKAGELEYVFSSGGKNFFRFINEQRIPASRALKALDVYGELELKVDRVYLEGVFAAMEESLNKGKLADVVVLIRAASDRIKFLANFDIMYKLAAVLYVGEGENPEDYDDELAAQKVALWQKEKDVKGFFLRTPLIEFLPFSNLSDSNLRDYIQAMRKNDQTQLLAIFKILYESKGNDETLLLLERAIENSRSLTSSSD